MEWHETSISDLNDLSLRGTHRNMANETLRFIIEPRSAQKLSKQQQKEHLFTKYQFAINIPTTGLGESADGKHSNQSARK